MTMLLKGNMLHNIKQSPSNRAALPKIPTMPDQTKLAFKTKNFRGRWDKAMEYSVPRNFRFHDLRHTFASWARMDDADSADICAALDHSNIANTMPYAHIDPADHATTFNRISGQVVHNR